MVSSICLTSPIQKFLIPDIFFLTLNFKKKKEDRYLYVTNPASIIMGGQNTLIKVNPASNTALDSQKKLGRERKGKKKKGKEKKRL